MEELDLKEIFYMFWNKKISIIIITVICAIVGAVYTYNFVTPMYKASSSLVLVQITTLLTQKADEAITTTDLTINSELVSTYSELIKTDKILGVVANNLNLSEAELARAKGNISVGAVADTQIIEIIVRDENPQFAAKLANEIAKVFSEKIVDIYNISNVYLLDEAVEPTYPCNINHVKDIAKFFLGGIVLSVAYVLVINMLDNTIKSEEDVTSCSGLKNLAFIPDFEKELKSKKGGRE